LRIPLARKRDKPHHGFKMTNTNTEYTAPATRTEITGKDAASCTGRTNTSKRPLTFRLGDAVSVEIATEAPEGGQVFGYRTAKIERIATGTEHGMHGVTALVVLTIEGAQRTFPARYLAHAVQA
jgi:hypothetical protein